MDFADVLELASEFTVQQMIERQMFRKRIDAGKPVGLHEFLYPIMQGWDSVCLDVDIEVGGSDQIFNMLVGTTLVKRHRNKQKFVIAGQLLVDPSGKKIGKTEGNMITLNDTPLDTYHKIMLWGDAITPHALELCSNMPMSEVHELAAKLKSGEVSGLDGKMILARTIVTDLHGAEAAAGAEAEYHRLTSKNSGDVDRSILTIQEVQVGENIIDLLVKTGLAQSKRAARELAQNGAVRIDGTAVDAEWCISDDLPESILQVGKKKLENHRLLKLKN
jgi:tyrosyl-tRNA synthetase